MARGGRRSGRPGEQYGNRSDLQAAPRLAPSAPKDQPYGVVGQQLASQAQIPLGPPPISLSAPTTRAQEPIQSGLSQGPGPGPEAALLSTPDPVETTLRALYQLYPNRDLAELLEDIDRGATF